MVYIPVNVEEAVKRECKRRGYSNRTIETYLLCINRFLKFTNKTINKISKKDVREFLEYLSDRGKAGNTLNTYHMAIRFLFEDVLDKRIWLDIKYSKVPEKLPVVLSKEEVKNLINVISNSKHKLMISLLYGAGLRVSELINLRVKDLQIDDSYGWVRGGKGNKDRLFLIANSLKPAIKELMEKENLSEEGFLFNSNRNDKYDVRSLQEIIKKARKKSKIEKPISCHTLRHSFATHLIEQENSLQEVQALLGHKSPETTQVYLHTAIPKINIKSPIDSL